MSVVWDTLSTSFAPFSPVLFSRLSGCRCTHQGHAHHVWDLSGTSLVRTQNTWLQVDQHARSKYVGCSRWVW